MGIYDAVPHFRDSHQDQQGFPVINMESANYRNYFFWHGDREGQQCPNPGIAIIDYN
jgi:hypothetical protein